MREKLAIEGGEPLRTDPFPSWPVFDHREEEALSEVVRSGQWGVLTGMKVKEFEARFAEFQAARYGICVVNGTAALEIAMRAAGIGPGDEVITTPYTFIATASAALLVGALPVFVDIDPETYLLDVTKVEEAITERTKALVPVHIGGCPADMDAIMDIASKHGLRVIEDACQAWGAEWKGRRVGAIGHLGAFSFQASKNITAGEGGIIVTNDAPLADRCWSLHNVGRLKGGAWYEHEILGWNYRMTEWQGAVLLVQLERLPEQIARRSRNAAYLAGELGCIEGIRPLTIDERVTQHAWHLFIFRYEADRFGGLSRDAFIEALNAEGIPCSAGYRPLNRSRAILEATNVATPASCPVAERACCEEAVWLPQNVLLGTRQDMDHIVEAVAKIQRAKS
ncbi:MAG: DegT/DnrJ/EryC1/StrS family aminotransferase [Anaerolineae bacterium]